MKELILGTFGKSLSLLTMTALVVVSMFGFSTIIAYAEHGDDTVKVNVHKYVEGVQATSENANDASFPMSSTWSAEHIGAGSGTYALASSNATPYQVMTSEMATGADYTTSETLDGSVVGASCETEQPFALVGYTSGDTLEAAQSATPTLTPPSFTDMTSDKFVIVWNDDCSVVAPEGVSVTIHKYVDDVHATAENADGADFPMSSTWNDDESGAGTGTYSLNSANSYSASTSAMASGFDYTTNEMLDGSVVGASCETEQPFALVGYTSGDTLEAAQSATPTLTPPSFTDMTSDKFVIVWNMACDDDPTDGPITGDVTDGPGVLAVTSIDAVDTSATADNTYENGWEYIFHITVPTDESNLAMKFSDWMSGSSTMPVAGNIRISSAQADNGGATITVDAANTYTTPNLHMVTDLDTETDGIQVEITVEVKIPVGTSNGSYSTTYGVKSE